MRIGSFVRMVLSIENRMEPSSLMWPVCGSRTRTSGRPMADCPLPWPLPHGEGERAESAMLSPLPAHERAG